jgi:DNA invertase Pin-like site-specific DNA recombinase
MKQPYVYLRKSRVFRDQEVVSPEMQLAAAQEYARQFGDANLVVLTDLNKSGRKGRRDRPGFDALLSAIESGACSAVYSYSLSRLSRSVRDIMALADLCRERGVPIRLARDTDPDPTTATGRAVLALLGVMAQLEADLASERALDAVEARRARGDSFGGPVYADHETVIAAFEAAGSCTGAARLLNLRSVPTLRGKGTWYPSSVRVILDRAAPDLAPAGQRASGAKAAAPFLFYRLLRCHCDTILTGMRRRNGYTSYRCTRGRLDPLHGKTHVAESVLLPWAIEEAARLRPTADLVALGETSDAERGALVARLERVRVAWVNGLYRNETEMLAEKAAVTEALTRLDLQGRAVAIPPVVWNREPVEVNRALRALWGHVQLDGALRPVDAAWLVPPEWLAPRGA